MSSNGVILENLSGRKLLGLSCIALLLQVFCFLLGATVAPAPSSVDPILATKCIDERRDTKRLLHSRGRNRCRTLDSYGNLVDSLDDQELTDRVVYTFQLPLSRDGAALDYSRWQQNMIGILQFDVSYYWDIGATIDVPLLMNVTLAYRDKYEGDDNWHIYSTALVQRQLHCSTELKKQGYLYNCSLVPLFELGSLYHDFYLINVRMLRSPSVKSKYQLGIRKIVDLWLVCINQNGGFTKVWAALKCIFFCLIVGTLSWFWKRVYHLQRPPVLLEYTLFLLGISLMLLNAPIELLSLLCDMPALPLFQDIKQGLFYAALFSFWLIFAGEHLIIQDPHPHHLRQYWKHLSGVITGCIFLLIYDVWEKGGQVTNPFYSIWVTDFSANLALCFLFGAAICAVLYLSLLCFMIWRVLRNITAKEASLPNMPHYRRLRYEGVIYRFKFLMFVTVVCASLTIAGFLLGRVSEGNWKGDDGLQLEYTSGFFTGVYGMWNLYICALLVLYCPSAKQKQCCADSVEDRITMTNEELELSEASVTATGQQSYEVSSLLIAFAQKHSQE